MQNSDKQHWIVLIRQRKMMLDVSAFLMATVQFFHIYHAILNRRKLDSVAVSGACSLGCPPHRRRNIESDSLLLVCYFHRKNGPKAMGAMARGWSCQFCCCGCDCGGTRT
jgi:hypothetical protein